MSQMMAALAQQPISIAIEADQVIGAFECRSLHTHKYTSGVKKLKCCVVCVGATL
jgi:hypothetical protein